jgi:hypothetical protein
LNTWRRLSRRLFLTAAPPSQRLVGHANILTFTHFSVDKLGINFFTIDLLKSNSVDPANGGSSGAQEWYGLHQRDSRSKH